jgi:hypothetical protein
MLNPNAVTTPGTCAECGGHIEAMYCVQLCDDCIDARIPAKPCHTCGAMSKYHPRMTRFYGDRPWEENPPIYFCAEHAGDALLVGK